MCNFLSAVLKRDVNSNQVSIYFSKSGSDSHQMIVKENIEHFNNLDDFNFASVEILEDRLVLDETTQPYWAKDYLRNNTEMLFNFRVQREAEAKQREREIKKILRAKKEIIEEVYELLKNRSINPCGEFDNAGRWYADNDDLISVRTPSRAYPYSQMIACRTKKYVQKVLIKYNCNTVEELKASV